MKNVARIVLVLALAAVFVVGGCRKRETATTETTAATETTLMTVAESTGVAECDSYLAALEKYMNCSNVPQAARDAQKQAADQMRTSWASWGSLPEEARKVAQGAARTSCSTALTSLKQAAMASGCPVE